MKVRHCVSGQFFTLFPVQLEKNACPCLFSTVLTGLREENEAPCSEHSSSVGLQQEEASCLPAVMSWSFPEGRNRSCLSLHIFWIYSQITVCLWGELVCVCVMKRGDGEKNEGKLAEQADHHCRGRGRIWEQMIFSHYCTVKANSTVSSCGLRSFSKRPFF